MERDRRTRRPGAPPTRAPAGLRPLSESSFSDAVAWAVVENAPDGIVAVDDDGRIVVANDRVEALFGYDRAELLGQPVELLLPTALRAGHEAHRQRYEAEPHTRPMGEGLQLVGRHRDGSQLPVEISLSPVTTDEGRLVVAVIRDVGRRRTAERAAQAARDRRVALIEALDDGLVETDLEARVVGATGRFCDLVGLERHEVVGQAPPHPWTPPEELPALEISLQELAPAGRGHLSTQLLRPDGSRVHVEIAVSTVRGPDGAPVGGLWLVRDVTDRVEAATRLRTAERELARLEDQERIARDLHDLIIQDLYGLGLTLQGAASRSREPSVAARLQEAVRTVDETIRSTRTIIFGLSRRDAAGGGLRREVLAVADEAGRVLGFAPKVHFAGPVDVAVPERLHDHVLAVLHESLSNVARHAGASRVDIDLVADERLTVRVTDDGCGLGDQGGGGRGLGNLRARAAAAGGDCDVRGAAGDGTVLEWTAPLS